MSNTNNSTPRNTIRDEQHILTETDSAETSKTRYVLQRGTEKRSLIQDSISYSEPAFKRAMMDDELLSGDDLEGEEFDADEQASPVRPVSNFSMENNPNALNGYRTVNTGIPVSKKLVIKNFIKKEAQPQELMTTSWDLLRDSVIAIQTKRKVASSLEQLYQIVVNLCEKKMGEDVYENLQKLIREHVIQARLELSDFRDSNGDDFLVRMDRKWSDYCREMTMIRHVFLVLDRNYILPNSSLMSIWESALSIFREEIMENSKIQKRVVEEILRVISLERAGNQVDRNLLRSLLRMFSNLHIYTQVFETEFLASSEKLFSDEGDAWSKELEAAEYLRKVQHRLAGESSRVDFYLDEATRHPLYAIAENCLIAKHMEAVLRKGLDELIKENHTDDLRLAFNLLSRVKDGVNLLKNGMVTYIKRIGKEIVMDVERDSQMVESLMYFKRRIDVIVEQCFDNNEKFMQAEKDAFDYFINTRPNKPAELIAKYMDAKLRIANKESSDEELDKLMDVVITLFRFIQGKDVFEAFYKKDLAKRLLLGRSASVDAEKAMLSKLKQECGAGFTHKLEGMFKDMELSKDLAISFKQHNDHAANLGEPSVRMDFQVNVLTLGQWPPYEPVEVTLPAQMGQCLQMYQDFYVSKHSNRRLQWQHSLGQCMLKGNFRTGCTKELQVSLYQAIVLLLFNDCCEYTYEAILDATKIDAKELRRTLVSLACGKIRVLNKSPRGKEVNDGDKFSLNTELQERLYRIKISQVQMKETEEEHKQTEEQVNQDRQYQIDAAVVRVMKTRKTLSHRSLITELFQQLRFPVESSDLKKRISSLIERDYICRDNDDNNLYKYVS